MLKEVSALTSEGRSKKKVLIVDENVPATKTIIEALHAREFSTFESLNCEDGIEKAVATKPDMIIVNSMISNEHNLVKTLRCEKGMENIFFLLLAEKKLK